MRSTQQLLQILNTIHSHDTCMLFQAKENKLLWSNHINLLDDFFIFGNEKNTLNHANNNLTNLFNNLESNSINIYKKMKNNGLICYTFNKTTINSNDKLNIEYNLWVLKQNLILSINDIVNYMLFSHKKLVNVEGIVHPQLSKRELEVLFFSLHNWSSSDISNALELVNGQVVSKNTIANIKRNIMTKMECFNLNDMAHKSYICGYNLILPEELVFNHIH